MMQLIDPILSPGTATAFVAVGPGFALLTLAAIAVVAWAARKTAEELRKIAARDWERRTLGVIETRPAAARSSAVAA